MSKFSILHLSDLHISHQQEPSHTRIRSKLIDDLKKNILSKNQLTLDAIVITGDIVDRGGEEDKFGAASLYIDELREKLELSLNQIIIVPGNHDYSRDRLLNYFMQSTFPSEDDKPLYDDSYKAISSRFAPYVQFIEEKMGINSTNYHYGGTVTDLNRNQGRIRFIQLDSAWSTTGMNEYGNLLVGKWQLEGILSTIKGLPKADLNIALMHHPIDWFAPKQKSMLINFLTQQYLFAVDIVLHGHIHENRAEAYLTPDGTLVGLVSGIGYPEKETRVAGFTKLGNCRYSVYQIDTECGVVGCWVRKSNTNGIFAADTELYEAGANDGHFPINYKVSLAPQNNSCGKMPISVPEINDKEEMSKKGSYYSDDYLKERKEVVILDSFDDKLNDYCIVKKQDLCKKNIWPNWAFAVLLLTSPKEIVIERIYDNNSRENLFKMIVDISKTSYGIYNSTGKDYLKNKFRKNFPNTLNASQQLLKFLSCTKKNNDTFPFDFSTLRWASGGIIPVVKWKKRDWVVLIFRGVDPIGWNIANGASESESEYINLHEIIFREFSEEIVLLDREPNLKTGNNRIRQKTFQFRHLPSTIYNEDFSAEHRKLRNDDGLEIVDDSDQACLVEFSRTNFSVEVRAGDGLRNPIEDVIFTINPKELGIEVVKIAKFEMDDNDYIINGEILEKWNTLAREPVMLISLDFLHREFRANGNSLGNDVIEESEAKRLAKIPSKEYHIFNYDMFLRDLRLEHKNCTEEETEFHKNWKNNYEHLFMKALGDLKPDLSSDSHGWLTTLCPVTWKTLELALCHNKLK